MAQDPSDFEDNWPARKPGSRLVWIVPSVVLHLIVIGVWFAMPAEEARKPEKKVHIKSEQVEQLKEHIEDANLQELHQEVRRLQEIKQAMADIRAEELVGLQAFENEIRGSLDTDARQTLVELQAAQDGLSKAQGAVIQELKKIEALFTTMQPLLERKALTEVIPHARQVLDIRNGLKPKMEELDRQFLLVQAKFEAAEAVFGWITGNEVATSWDELSKLQDRIIVMQSASSDELGQLQIRQSEALKRLVDGGGGIEQQIQQSLDQEKTAQLDYEAELALHTENQKKAETDAKTLEVKVAEVDASVLTAKAERDRMSKEMQSFHGNSPEIRQQRTAAQKELKEQDQVIMKLYQEKKKTSIAFNQAKSLASRSEQRLKQLRPPTPRGEQERKRLAESMERDLQAIDGKAGNIASQQEAFELQKQALQQTQSLIEAVDDSKEVSK